MYHSSSTVDCKVFFTHLPSRVISEDHLVKLLNSWISNGDILFRYWEDTIVAPRNSAYQLLQYNIIHLDTYIHSAANLYIPYFSLVVNSLCSRNFQNVKLRLDFVEIWLFYRHSDFTWNQILANSKGTKM